MDIRSEVSDVNEVTKQVKLSIPPEKFKAEFEVVIVDLMKSSKVKGFREGKAPRHIVEKLHGERVKFEVVNRLISSGLYGLIREKSIDMVGQPEIDISAIEPDKEINVTANISVFPKPEIKGYDKFTVEIEKREVKPADIDQVVERLRTSKATARKLEFRNEAKAGDVIDASLLVAVDGETPTRPEPLSVALGEGHLPKELEEGIVGMEVGSAKEISGFVPEDYRDEALRGKPVKYTVTLNGLSERVLPEPDDAFAAGTDMGVKTFLGLRVEIGKRLEAEQQRDTQSDTQAAILDQLLEKNQFQVPQLLIDEEIKNLLVRGGFLNPEKINIADLNVEPFREGLGEVATKRVRSAIVIDRIGEAEKLAATDEDVNKSFEATAQQSGVSVDEVKRYFMTKERLVRYVMDVTRDKVLAFLRDRATVKQVEKKAEDSPKDSAKSNKK